MTKVIYLTENGYTLCAEHMEQWLAGGWDGGQLPMSPEEAMERMGLEDDDTILCADCDDAAHPDDATAPAIGCIRELANGERWRFGGHNWHMLGGTDYAPVAGEHFESYSDCIRAGVWRQFAGYNFGSAPPETFA